MWWRRAWSLVQRRLSFIISIIYVQENDAEHSTVLNTEYIWLLYNIPFPSSPPFHISLRELSFSFSFSFGIIWFCCKQLKAIKGCTGRGKRLGGEGGSCHLNYFHVLSQIDNNNNKNNGKNCCYYRGKQPQLFCQFPTLPSTLQHWMPGQKWLSICQCA